MTLSRRDFLQQASLAATAAALAACRPLTFAPAANASPAAPAPTPPPAPGQPVPGVTPAPPATLLTHTLRRLTFSPTPQIRARAESLGLQAWVEEQLGPQAIDDSATDAMLARFTTFNMTPRQRFELENRAQPAQEIIAATLLRQRFSQRQLHELMVDFWSNHFNIYIGKNQCRVLKTDDDLHVIRPHALGRFRELLGASARSPAMLVYLDQATSTRDVPNENYARELLELHTLSVDSGYSHHDVEAVARALTGWSVVGPRDRRFGPEPGTYVYRPGVHDNGEKHLLDLHLPAGGGEQDGEMILDYVAGHDWTARFISTKLARRFVADSPPASLVNSLARVFTGTGGDLREVMRSLIYSAEFQQSAGQKIKRPLEFFISILRVTEAALGDRPRPLVEQLRLLGQVPFNWPPPDGYPDNAGWWMTTSGMLNRWNFALAVAHNQQPGVSVDLRALVADSQSPADRVDQLSLRFVGEVLPPDARDVLIDFANAGGADDTLAPLAGLILGSPYFQLR